MNWAGRYLVDSDVRSKKVIEVGAYDLNGSLRTMVETMDPAEYVGTDIRQGPGVDLICRAEDMVGRFGGNSFDVVICTCVLEHIREWKKAVSALKQVCRPGGLLLIIVPYRWSFHAYPGDYWRYAADDMSEIFADCEILNLEEDPAPPSLVYAKIRKPAGFAERDLSRYCLYSIIAGKRKTRCESRDFFTRRFARLAWDYHSDRVYTRMIELLIRLQRRQEWKPNEAGDE